MNFILDPATAGHTIVQNGSGVVLSLCERGPIHPVRHGRRYTKPISDSR